MKTKTLVLVGIAACTILLISPVLASGGYSKIYGNANEDDVLDMRDVTYIKLVIFGKKPATAFADANYDGKISMLDVGQAKLIILGKEGKLTLVDKEDRAVTIYKPVERVVSIMPANTRIIVALGAANKLVGIDQASTTDFSFQKAYPEGEELPVVGMVREPNIELLLSLKPDVIFTWGGYGISDNVQEKTGIPVVGVHSYTKIEEMANNFRIIGNILGKEKEAEELISYANEELNKVREATSDIPDNEKPKVYLAFWSKWNGESRTPIWYEPVAIAGGINVAKDCPPTVKGYSTMVSIEQIVAWNPDIFLIHHGSSRASTPTVEDVLSDPRLQSINAVKNRKVYYTLGMWYGWEYPRVLTETLYMAKYMHPDKFEDLDLEKKGNEIFERFYGVDGLWTELGTECGYLQ